MNDVKVGTYLKRVKPGSRVEVGTVLRVDKIIDGVLFLPIKGESTYTTSIKYILIGTWKIVHSGNKIGGEIL